MSYIKEMFLNNIEWGKDLDEYDQLSAEYQFEKQQLIEEESN